jgi:hypothetical protein
MKLLVVLLSGGKIDYLPGANRPWSVDLAAGRYPGRGRTLWAAIAHHYGWA